MIKRLLLDVDGVINCEKTTARHDRFIGIDPYMALLVNRICEATGAEIVLSSTWRLNKESREEVKRFVFPEFIDVTPDLSAGVDRATGYRTLRGVEIQKWLSDHPEVERYAILDDDPAASFGAIPSCVFKTTWEKGLTEEIADRVIEHLNA